MLHTKGVSLTCTVAPQGTACISTSCCHTSCSCCSLCTWAAACSHLSARMRARVWFCCCACCSCTCRSAGPLLAASSLPVTTKAQFQLDQLVGVYCSLLRLTEPLLVASSLPATTKAHLNLDRVQERASTLLYCCVYCNLL